MLEHDRLPDSPVPGAETSASATWLEVEEIVFIYTPIKYEMLVRII